MRGLLADVNLQGHLLFLKRTLTRIDLLPILTAMGVDWATHRTPGLPQELDDRRLWHYCQQEGWVLFTDNRNREDEDSLGATLEDSWRPGHLPVITVGDKDRFESSTSYAERVGIDLAELLFGLKEGQYRDRPRIYVPQ